MPSRFLLVLSVFASLAVLAGCAKRANTLVADGTNYVFVSSLDSYRAHTRLQRSAEHACGTGRYRMEVHRYPPWEAPPDEGSQAASIRVGRGSFQMENMEFWHGPRPGEVGLRPRRGARRPYYGWVTCLR
ncbi:MAG TPA: hypothetical protein RMH99_00360 [Sandaracinaceae bacterium LLY-WYZ-13_1]|nr:hypothetical protein [Sandaracinaceae bacterium LLY-WYZ-13_1]